MRITLVLFAAVLVIYRFAARRKDFLATCEELVSQLPVRHYGAVSKYLVDESIRIDDKAFWIDSGGIRGLFERIQTARVYQHLVQAHYRAHRLTKDDAQYIWRRLCLLTWFSILAVPEAAVSALFPEAPHVMAQTALFFYDEVVMRSNTMCVTDGAPKCILSIRQLL